MITLGQKLLSLYVFESKFSFKNTFVIKTVYMNDIIVFINVMYGLINDLIFKFAGLKTTT